ncbi:MAG: glycosyltransferase [Planctomycetota bacterium]
MRIFMLGWEFPPYISGGLGTACYGLTRGLDSLDVEVLFVLPRPIETTHSSHVRLLSPATPLSTTSTPGALDVAGAALRQLMHAKFWAVDSNLRPYVTPAAPEAAAGEQSVPQAKKVSGPGGSQGAPSARPPGEQSKATKPESGPGGDYTGDLFIEIQRYAGLAAQLAGIESFDLIHAHDWMTYLAGIAVADLTGKPLVVHVHSTEFDRSGVHVNQQIYDIERAGIQRATRVICVSHLTRNIVLQHYGPEPRKVDVVYNAIDDFGDSTPRALPPIARDEKIVLFLGRITMQKGPEYFLAAAKRVLEIMDNVRFVMAGSGDLARDMMNLAAEMGLGEKVLFTGFLRGDDVRRVFRMADLYVMPSVSEPFGIAPLEALANDVPVLISKQSGVSEILTHALKVDFWDVDEMANKIIAVLRHPPLQATLRDHGNIEVRRLCWTDSARNCLRIYEKAVAGRQD